MKNTQLSLYLALATALLLGLGALATVQAQDRDDDPSEEKEQTRSGGGGFFAIGTHFTDLGPLNDRLADAGYPTFASETISLGGGGYGVVAGRVLLGGEGHGLITSDQGYQGRTVSVGGGYGLFTLGYLFRPASRVRVFPQLGLGGGGFQLDISSRGDVDNFDDVLDDPNRSASVGRGSFLVSLGAGLEYQFSKPDAPGGFRLGLRAGYLLAPQNSDWELGDTTLGDGPDATMQGPFLRLTIGGGGRQPDDD